MQFIESLTILLCVFFTGSRGQLNLIRLTRHGLISGSLERSRANSSIEYFSFKGVPYAQPPTGNLRFQEPSPPKPWLFVKSTTEARTPCIQKSNNSNGDDVIGSEDCLYLDVYVPKTASSLHPELLPVLVWLHGGTFIFGTTNTTGPDYFMEEPCIIVQVQYRVNVFGFLSTMDKYAKGNLGLKDQRLAFQWVKDNILFFGGNPQKVTIFGESAGGSSVLYHILSPGSLFHRAISQSGSTLNRWALQEHPKEMTIKLARGLGIVDTDSKTIVKKLQQVDPAILLMAAFNQSIVGWYTPFYAQPFGPSIEYESSTAVISESTFKLQKEGRYSKIPYLTGYNTEEGSFAYNYVLNGRSDINIFKENPNLLVPISMNVPGDSQCHQVALDAIIDLYFSNGNLSDKANWIPYMSQELFIRGIVKTMNLMYRKNPIYFYRFSYTGSRPPLSQLGGVGHFEDVQYLFYPTRPGSNTVESDADKRTRRRLITMWTNFAATGNPTPHQDGLLQNIVWPKAYPNKAFLDIGHNLTVLYNPNREESEFWDNLFNLCGNPPYVTY